MAFDIGALFSRIASFLRSLDAGPSVRRRPEPVRMNVLPDQDSVARGDQVTGSILIRGGSIESFLYDLSLDLFQLELGPAGETLVQRGSVSLAKDLAVPAGEVLTIPFSFRAPDDLRISESDDGVGRLDAGCRLVASATRFEGILQAKAAVHIRMQAPVEALLDAMVNCGFWGVGTALEDKDGHVVKRFRAMPSLEEWVHSAELRVEMFEGSILARLRLSPTSSGGHAVPSPARIIDRFRTQFEAPQLEEIPIEVAATDLITADGKPDVRSATSLLKEMLQKSMLLGNSDRSVLLRSAAEDSESVLLHPAPPALVDDSRLLRSVADPPDEPAGGSGVGT